MTLIEQGLHRIFPLGDPPDYEPAPEQSIAARAQREGRDPFEVLYDAMLERGGRQLMMLTLIGYSDGDLEAVRAMLELMAADPQRLQHRNAFNVTAMNFTPARLAQEIRKHMPRFVIDYEVDPLRQAIADSWPDSIDDGAARAEWDWAPAYDLETMTKDMLEELEAKLKTAK